LPLDPAAPRRQPLAQLCGIGPGGEQQHHRQRIRRPEHHLQSRVPLHDELQAPLLGDLVHRPGRAPPDLLLADGLDQPLTAELAQLRVQRPAGDPAPYLGVGQLGGPPDLVSVHRPALGQQAEDHEPTQVHHRLVCTY
jgi:hypothetical protein